MNHNRKRGRPQLVGSFWSKSLTFPSFVVTLRLGAKKTPTKRVGVVVLPSLFFFLQSAFFCLSFPCLPLLFDALKPKLLPTRRGLQLL